MVEGGCPDVIQMPQQSEETSSLFVVPNLTKHTWQIYIASRWAKLEISMQRPGREFGVCVCVCAPECVRVCNIPVINFACLEKIVFVFRLFQHCVSHFDFVVVASGDEERLLVVEADSTHRSIVLVELVDQSAHAIIPQLDNPIMQTRQDPGALRVERKSCM